jgi:hypothetical protein
MATFSSAGERLWTASQLTNVATVRFLRIRNREGCDVYQIISGNGPQFIAKDFKEFIRVSGMTHVRTGGGAKAPADSSAASRLTPAQIASPPPMMNWPVQSHLEAIGQRRNSLHHVSCDIICFRLFEV